MNDKTYLHWFEFMQSFYLVRLLKVYLNICGKAQTKFKKIQLSSLSSNDACANSSVLKLNIFSIISKTHDRGIE